MARSLKPPKNVVLGKMIRQWGFNRGCRMYFARANDPSVHAVSAKKPTKRSQ